MPLGLVMVVDDSDPDLLYTRIVLERAGVAETVLSFGTALEALAFLRVPDAPPVDLILLDINMPEMSGFEFLEAHGQLAGADEAAPAVVMLTSSPDPRDRERAMAWRQVMGYLVKPLDLDGARNLLHRPGAAHSASARGG